MTAILGHAEIPWPDAAAWSASRGAPATWARLAELYWSLAPGIGVRADVPWAQACKETGFGKFGRAVTPEHRNPCGLKIPDPTGLADNDPAAHQRFTTWERGVRAHLEHLALYAGVEGFPLAYAKRSAVAWSGATVDPRHFAYLWGRVGDSVEALGGNWAPAADYGESIVRDFLNPMTAFALAR